MTAAPPQTGLDIYQHDSADKLRFVLRGVLAGAPVRHLEHSWITASSTLAHRQLVVDVAGLAGADADGIELLKRMRSRGAQLVAARGPMAAELAHALNLPAPATSRGVSGPERWRRVFRVCIQHLGGLRRAFGFREAAR